MSSNTQIEKNELLNNARAQAFGPLLLERFQIEQIQTEEELWSFYNKKDFGYFPVDLFFNLNDLTSQDQHKKLELLNPPPSFKDNLLVKDIRTQEVAAIFHGWPKNFNTYYMQATAVHTHYRRCGIYSALLDRIIL